MDIKKILLNNKQYFEDFISRSTYHSNAIEGNTLSFAETYAIIFNDNSIQLSASPKEIYEAINHKYALNKIIKKEGLINKNFIIEINQTINKNILYIGGYRLGPVRIIGSEKKFPLPQELEEIMETFIKKYNNILKEDFDMKKLTEMHLEFENIHPFPDGNGRTGRLLINYILLNKNQIPIIIPIEKRNEYLTFMEKNDIEGLTKLFINLQNKEKERIEDFIKMNVN